MNMGLPNKILVFEVTDIQSRREVGSASPKYFQISLAGVKAISIRKSTLMGKREFGAAAT